MSVSFGRTTQNLFPLAVRVRAIGEPQPASGKFRKDVCVHPPEVGLLGLGLTGEVRLDLPRYIHLAPMLATNCPMPGRMDAAQASPMSARMAVSREQNDHPLVPRGVRLMPYPWQAMCCAPLIARPFPGLQTYPFSRRPAHQESGAAGHRTRCHPDRP